MDLLENASLFMWSNARLVDRHHFAFLFDDGPGGAVHAALRAYQNEDGGYGNGLEPDIRCPHSQPPAIAFALRVMTSVGADLPALERLCGYLTTITTADGGIPGVLPSVMAYPRAPWWRAGENPPADLNMTATIAGYLHSLGIDHPWLGPAAEFCWRGIATSDTVEVHELIAMVTFLEHVPDRLRAERESALLADRLRGAVALDPQAPGYVKKPLDFAPWPESLCRRLFEDEVMEAHLDALASRQQPDGGWPVTWQQISPAAEQEWRGWLTVDALRVLKAYGRLGS